MERFEGSFPAKVIYLSHGGGPLPLLGDAGHLELVDNLQAMAGLIGKPTAIIVVSAHWEAKRPTITAAAHPSLIYDYYGFPEDSYRISYPAAGAPELAARLCSLLKGRGLEAELDEQRGFDHGLFVPLKIMFPEADIPCLQLSLLNNLDPGQHLRLGAALARLDYPGLLVIGSGFSFHNMPAFFSPATAEAQQMNETFEGWLVETCSSPALDEQSRAERLSNWAQAPFARYCHPREEHLLPLHVCYGLAGRPCAKFFQLSILGKKASAYLW